VEGQQDLERRLIRAIGDPCQRFAEDKLRLVRAVRFAATYDFTLEAATGETIATMAGDVTVVSPERIAAEMRLMLGGARVARAVELLHEVGLLRVLLPEVGPQAQPLSAHTCAEAWSQTLTILQQLKNTEWTTSLAALLHDYAPDEQVEAIGRRWKLSNREVDRARWLVEHFAALRGARQMPWSRLQPLLISEGIGELLSLHEASVAAGGGDRADAQFCRQQLQRPAEELDPPLLLTGNDLIAHGVPRGKQYQWLLERVRAAQLDGHIADKASALALVDQWRASPDGGQ
jgi:poly(A) polymerase